MATWDCFLYHNLTKAHTITPSLGHDVDFLLFERQIVKIKENFDVVSPIEALDNINKKRKGKFATIWFDDGFKSILEIGLPILKKHNITATVSICSSLYQQQDLFWRKKLALILRKDKGTAFVRFLQSNSSLKGWNVSNIMAQSLDNFSEELISLLNSFIEQEQIITCHDTLSKEFCNMDDLKSLVDHDWHLSNHSSQHYPITETSAFHLIEQEFSKNNEQILQDFGLNCSLFVAPFCRVGKMDIRVDRFAKELKKYSRYLALVNEETNVLKNIEKGLIYRRTARTI